MSARHVRKTHRHVRKACYKVLLGVSLALASIIKKTYISTRWKILEYSYVAAYFEIVQRQIESNKQGYICVLLLSEVAPFVLVLTLMHREMSHDKGIQVTWFRMSQQICCHLRFGDICQGHVWKTCRRHFTDNWFSSCVGQRNLQVMQACTYEFLSGDLRSKIWRQLGSSTCPHHLSMI